MAAIRRYCYDSDAMLSSRCGKFGERGMADEQKIEVYFHKSNFFRVVHADGCFGGQTPRGGIHMGFYSERSAFPLRTELTVVDNKAVSETPLETKGGLVRELEVDVVMDFNSSISFYVWLKAKMQEQRQTLGISDADWSTMVGTGV